MTPNHRFKPQTAKWAILLAFVLVAGGLVVGLPRADDPMRPGLLVLLWTIWLKLFLEYGWQLPMRYLYVQLQPTERKARNMGMLVMTAATVGFSWAFFPW